MNNRNLEIVIDTGGHVLNLDRREYTPQGGKTVRLTPTETSILSVLMVNSPDVLNRSTIMYCAGMPEDTLEHNVTFHVFNLRRKIGPPDPIKSINGVGYTFRVNSV